MALGACAVLRWRLRRAMAAPWLGWEAPGRALRGLAWLGQEFAADWAAQDLRAALFQLLLLWLGLSLLGIHLAWRLHGGRVSRLCCRPGTGRTEPPGLGCAAAQVPTGTNGAPGPGPEPPTLRARLCCCPGRGGQNGGTPAGASYFPTWDSSSNEAVKTHRE
ncbi:T-cell leukemia translocation-altered gene protein isoform X1 [Terrapene carolina triunguis]|uniref:T-cell leukemia translocation-altered gene protein isoform X1 n=1 Tax=Terrapene triunguis TaxID=2587831 RepID=UPI000CEF8760|nr:T-cell leukemia translocation-altered gene protein isoform X1 [Terrapene carolina triunguis]